jgi:hypothetical protein
MNFFHISSDILKTRASRGPAVFDALSNKNKKSRSSMKFHSEILEIQSAIFDPCLAIISLMRRRIGLKILS